MVVLKKINNNVAICKDSNQQELVAFGKGIGFPPTPYVLTDLRKIERTFYNVSSQYISMLNDIPYEIIQFTATQLLLVQDELPYKAIISSGPSIDPHPTTTSEETQAEGAAFIEKLGLTAETISQIEDIPYETLLNAAIELGLNYTYGAMPSDIC